MHHAGELTSLAIKYYNVYIASTLKKSEYNAGAHYRPSVGERRTFSGTTFIYLRLGSAIDHNTAFGGNT